MSHDEALPVLPHLASDFYLWLWWASERQEGTFDLGDEVGRVTAWVDERLAFRRADDTRVTAVLTGESPSTTLEAHAALVGGKVLQELRMGIRRDEREYLVTLRGPAIQVHALKMPPAGDEVEQVLYDRMHLYEELQFVLGALFQRFAELRSTDSWEDDILPDMRSWAVNARTEPSE